MEGREGKRKRRRNNRKQAAKKVRSEREQNGATVSANPHLDCSTISQTAIHRSITAQITVEVGAAATRDPIWTISYFDEFLPHLKGTRTYWIAQLTRQYELEQILWPDAWRRSTAILIYGWNPVGNNHSFPAGWWRHEATGAYYPPQISENNVATNGTVYLRTA